MLQQGWHWTCYGRWIQSNRKGQIPQLLWFPLYEVQYGVSVTEIENRTQYCFTERRSLTDETLPRVHGTAGWQCTRLTTLNDILSVVTKESPLCIWFPKIFSPNIRLRSIVKLIYRKNLKPPIIIYAAYLTCVLETIYNKVKIKCKCCWHKTTNPT